MKYLKLFEFYDSVGDITEDIRDLLTSLDDIGYTTKVTSRKVMSSDMRNALSDLRKLYTQMDHYSKILKIRLKDKYRDNWIVDYIDDFSRKYKYDLEVDVIITKDDRKFKMNNDILETMLTINSMVDDLPEVHVDRESGNISLLLQIDMIKGGGYQPTHIEMNRLVLTYNLKTNESWDLLQGFN